MLSIAFRGVLTALALTLACGAASAQPAASTWKPVPGPIQTKWAADVKPAAPWPEYPRPTMARERWQNLNGLWDYAIGGAEAPKAWQGTILVPFPVESSLSGVAKPVSPDQTLHYRRTFRVPAEWRTNDQRTVLHFGAVDWRCQVSVNGKVVGEHSGGYDPFSLDITNALKAEADQDNEITLSVTDPTNTGGQPRGKQWSKPHGIWYTPTSGIWQTVWIEPVPSASIGGLKIETDPAKGKVTIALMHTVSPKPTAGRERVEVEVLADGVKVAGDKPDEVRAQGVVVTIPNAKKWTPDNPYLYTARVKLLVDGKEVDRVDTYFGLRSITVGKDQHGVNRLLLNDEPVFQFGPLDQGFWPDGLYTAPTVEAMKFDIEAAKKMGCNMLRKHVKVEPELFYYWCDKMGMLVWQDIPSPFFKVPAAPGQRGWDENFPAIDDKWKQNFESETLRIIQSRINHPSIVMWVPWNEGWGQNDLEWSKKVVEFVKTTDPSRLVNNASGWTDMKAGDTMDVHIYPGPGMAPVEPARASVLGEFGGLGLPIPGHVWQTSDNWGYVSYKNPEEVTNAYVKLIERLRPLVCQGLSAAVYTQTTDVEIEVNGWLTYDREVWKIDPAKALAATKPLYGPVPRVVSLVPNASRSPAGQGPTWSYTTAKPADDWFKPGFKPDTAWKEGKAGFGTSGTPGAVIGTTWNSSDIWLRRTVNIEQGTFKNVWLSIHHDESAEVYINGVLAAKLDRWSDGYLFEPISSEARAALKKGENTIAVHCSQTNGGQNIDVGLVDLTND